ncbi:hypothetical protein BGAL_0308g00100 [Botrytis galanthina]|uniref:Uncharacterized protein n=1 Tax=Botrytis galanthina TaxID=278940 RepID=A0A4S8QQS6_9HELO|nr:hypothetical protein BGAL_0308g00100 [Botrytis galanthina]
MSTFQHEQQLEVSWEQQSSRTDIKSPRFYKISITGMSTAIKDDALENSSFESAKVVCKRQRILIKAIFGWLVGIELAFY